MRGCMCSIHLPILALALALVGCGGKGGGGEEDGTDVTDAPEVTDTSTDSTPDTGPDTSPDVEPDTSPDAEPDTEPDTPADVPEDEGCVPSGVGSPPSEALDACLMALGCVALPDVGMGGYMEFCLARSYYEAYPLYLPIMDLIGYLMYETYFFEMDANTTCLAGAADCDQAFACLSAGSTSPSCSTPAVDWPISGQSCSGDVATVCINTEAGTTNGRTFEHDCAAEGLSCVEITGFGAACLETDCTTPAEPECDGRDIDYCIAPGAHLVIDCDDLSHGAGGTCGDSDPSTTEVEVGCIPRGRACDPTTDTPYCDVDTLFTCDATHGSWVGLDCTDLDPDWFCDDSVDPPECSPDLTSWTCTLTVEPACDCDAVVLCNPMTGTDLRLECPDYGSFATCGDTDTSTPALDAGCI